VPENEPTHLIMFSIVKDNPILPITVNSTDVLFFLSKILDEVFTGYGINTMHKVAL
jgi:hypothetical protein